MEENKVSTESKPLCQFKGSEIETDNCPVLRILNWLNKVFVPVSYMAWATRQMAKKMWMGMLMLWPQNHSIPMLRVPRSSACSRNKITAGAEPERTILIPISNMGDAMTVARQFSENRKKYTVLISNALPAEEYKKVLEYLSTRYFGIRDVRQEPFNPSCVNLTAYSTTDVVEFQCPPSTQVTVEIPDVVDEQLYDLIAAEAFAKKFGILNGKHATCRRLEKAGEKVLPKVSLGWYMKWGFLTLCAMITGVVIKKASPGPLLQVNLNPQFYPKFNFHMWEMLWGRIKEKEEAGVS